MNSENVGRLGYDRALAEAYLEDNHLRANKILDAYIQDWRNSAGPNDEDHSSDHVLAEIQRFEERRGPIAEVIEDYHIEEPVDLTFILELDHHFTFLEYRHYLGAEVSLTEQIDLVLEMIEVLKTRNQVAQEKAT